MKYDSRRDWASLALLSYLAVLLALTLLPGPGTERDRAVDVHLEPFATIDLALQRGPGTYEFTLLVGNLVAFVPLGLLLPVVLRRRSAVTVLGAAIALSAGIELAQFAISTAVGYDYRTADVDDVIVNVTGALLGYLALLIIDAARR